MKAVQIILSLAVILAFSLHQDVSCGLLRQLGGASSRQVDNQWAAENFLTAKLDDAAIADKASIEDSTPQDIQPTSTTLASEILTIDSVSQATSALPASIPDSTTENIIIPTEDPSLLVVAPAGGQVVKGGAGVLGIVLTQGMVSPAASISAPAPGMLVTSAGPVVAAAPVVMAVGGGSSYGASPASSYAAASTVAAVTSAPSYGYPAPAAVASYGSSYSMPVTMAPAPVTSAPAPVAYASPAATTAGYATAAKPSMAAAPMASYATPPAAYASPSPSASQSPAPSSYGSSAMSSYSSPVTMASYASPPASYSSSSSYGSSNSASNSGTSSSATLNSIGLPYGYYTQVQYLPYAQNASSQLTSPLIFSPYLPIPQYINQRFGLSLAAVQGRR